MRFKPENNSQRDAYALWSYDNTDEGFHYKAKICLNIFDDMKRFYVYDEKTGELTTPFYSEELKKEYDPVKNPQPHMKLLQEKFSMEYLQTHSIYLFQPGQSTPQKLVIRENRDPKKNSSTKVKLSLKKDLDEKEKKIFANVRRNPEELAQEELLHAYNMQQELPERSMEIYRGLYGKRAVKADLNNRQSFSFEENLLYRPNGFYDVPAAPEYLYGLSEEEFSLLAIAGLFTEGASAVKEMKREFQISKSGFLLDTVAIGRDGQQETDQQANLNAHQIALKAAEDFSKGQSESAGRLLAEGLTNLAIAIRDFRFETNHPFLSEASTVSMVTAVKFVELLNKRPDLAKAAEDAGLSRQSKAILEATANSYRMDQENVRKAADILRTPEAGMDRMKKQIEEILIDQVILQAFAGVREQLETDAANQYMEEQMKNLKQGGPSVRLDVQVAIAGFKEKKSIQAIEENLADEDRIRAMRSMLRKDPKVQQAVQNILNSLKSREDVVSLLGKQNFIALGKKENQRILSLLNQKIAAERKEEKKAAGTAPMQKPVHKYLLDPDQLKPDYKNYMDRLDYQRLSVQPSKIPGYSVQMDKEDTLQAVDHYLHVANYNIIMNKLKLDYEDDRLSGMMKQMIGNQKTYAEIREQFEKQPDKYCNPQSVQKILKHFAMIFDAVSRDIECSSIADYYADQVYLRSNMQKPVRKAEVKAELKAPAVPEKPEPAAEAKIVPENKEPVQEQREAKEEEPQDENVIFTGIAKEKHPDPENENIIFTGIAEDRKQKEKDAVREPVQKEDPARMHMLPKTMKAGTQSALYLQHAENLLNDSPAVNKSFRNFRTALNRLNTYAGELSRPQKDQKPVPVEAAQLEVLKKKYDEARKAGASLLKICAAKGPKYRSGLEGSVRAILLQLQKDRRTLDRYDPSRGLTFPQIADAAHSEYIDAGDQKFTNLSGSMSTRIAMNVRMEDGDGHARYAKGLFTEAEYADKTREYRNVLHKYKLDGDPSNAPATEEEKALARIFTALKRTEGNDLDIAASVLLQLTRDNNGDQIRQFMFKNAMYVTEERYHWINDVLNNDANKAGWKRFLEFGREFTKALGKTATWKNARIPDKGRVDQRSSAMSAVAELMGNGKLIAKSVPMKLKKGDQLIKGTFTEFSEYADPVRSPVEFSKLTMQSFQNEQFLKDTADLQVLDFICGNVDRHEENMFYRIEGGQVTGVQGIDHDLSFGLLDDNALTGKVPVTNFKGLDHMCFITKKTEQVIQGISKEELEAVLTPYGLSAKEIQAACHRLEVLKKAIIHPEIADHQVAASFRPGKLVVLDDEQIRNLAARPGTLFQREGRRAGMRQNKPMGLNHFTSAIYSLNMALTDVKKGVFNQQTELKVADLAAPAGNVLEPADLAAKLQKHIDELERKNSGAFISSQEYRNVLAYTRKVQESLLQLKPSPEDPDGRVYRERIAWMMENLECINQMYLEKKDLDGSLQSSERANERYNTVRSLQDTVTDTFRRMNITPYEDYCRLSAVQRAKVYRPKTDSRQIAEYISHMHSNQDQSYIGSMEIRKYFAGVSSKAYQQTFAEYQTSIQKILSRGLPHRNPAAAAGGPLQEKAGEAMEKMSHLLPTAEGMENLQQVLTELQTQVNAYLQSEAQKTPQDLIRAHELLHLTEAAGNASASPKSEYQQRIAENMTRIYLHQHPEQLQNPDGYASCYKQYLNSDEMTVLSAGRNPEQMKKYAEEPERTLTSHWQKATARLVKLNREERQLHYEAPVVQ